MLRLSVIIPTYRRGAELRRCLEALAQTTRPPDETLVAVAEGDEETRALLEGLHELGGRLGLRLVSSPVAGQIPQMNAALAQATGEVVCFTDDDCVPHRDWLERLAAPYADPQVGGVGGRDVVHLGERISTEPGRQVGRLTWWGRLIGNHHHEFPPGLVEVAHLKGANMSFRRALLPGFDLRMVGGSCALNDTDASLTVAQGGCRLLYDPQAVVEHYPAARAGASTRRLDDLRLVFSDSHNWTYCMLKHLPPGRRVAFLAYATLVGMGNRIGLVKYLLQGWRRPGRATRQLSAALRGVAAGLRSWRAARREAS